MFGFSLAISDVPCHEVLVPLCRALQRQYQADVFDCSNIAMVVAQVLTMLMPSHTVDIVTAKQHNGVNHAYVRIEAAGGEQRYYDPRRPRQILTADEWRRTIKRVTKTRTIEAAKREPEEYRLAGKLHYPEWMKR